MHVRTSHRPPQILLGAMLLLAAAAQPLHAQQADAAALLPPALRAPITPPPPGFDPHYVKHVDALGIPVLGSAAVSDLALQMTRDLVVEMLALRPDARAKMIAQGFRLVVMAPTEQTTDVPEHSLWTVPAIDDWRLTTGERARYNEPGGLGSQTPQQYWNRRARGMDDNPTTCAEENVLGLEGDRYRGENICVHEFVHSIMQYGLKFSDPELYAEIEAAYAAAVAEDLWRGQYARTNAKEYFAEAAQTYFWSNIEFRDGDRCIRSADDLRSYDPRVHALVERVFASPRLRSDVYHGRNLRQVCERAGG
jgi:hypothetical protein